LVYDWETGSKNKFKTQPTQLAALAIDGRSLSIIEGSIFDSEIKPILDDEEAIRQGLDPIEDEALDITHKTREGLAKAPELKEVWNSFCDYTARYKTAKNNWGNPVRAGYNICNFDNAITDRLCQQFGQWDNVWQAQTLFHPIHNIDVMHDIWRITENIRINSTNSISMDSIRDWLGMSKENAHDAKADIYDTAEIMIRFIKLYRGITNGSISCAKCDTKFKVKFEKALSTWRRPTL
jgi:hypothetical protein